MDDDQKKRYLIVGNWKMNLDINKAEKLFDQLCDDLSVENVDVVACPPVVFLEQMSLIAGGYANNIAVGVQNIHWEESGAFTGEVAVGMVEKWAKYVIVGHSERRHYFSETSNVINKKIKLALKYNLVPVLCVGEKRFFSSVDVAEIGVEMNEALSGLSADEVKKVVIAYEPVWAIGNGMSADPVYANRIIMGLRNWLKDEYSFEVAEQVRFLYGGSVDAKNAKKYLQQMQVDGLLIGGTSLKAKSFLRIIAQAGKLAKSIK
jgi:triosephosphate isomerase